eukprot:4227049-Alexandrium_andersonii.AAC.1
MPPCGVLANKARPSCPPRSDAKARGPVGDGLPFIARLHLKPTSCLPPTGSPDSPTRGTGRPSTHR